MGDADPVNAITQIKAFNAALPASAGQSDNVRSYDLMWLLHIVGDVHQPLHATARFTKEMRLKYQLGGTPDLGDRGGNDVTVSPATGETMALHAYWDGMFGGYSTVYGAIFDSFVVKRVAGVEKNIPKLLPPDPAKAAVSDPDIWPQESFDVAKQYTYAERGRDRREPDGRQGTRALARNRWLSAFTGRERGFGTRLVEATAAQLGGAVRSSWDDSGLLIELRLSKEAGLAPLGEIQAETPAAPTARRPD